MLWVGVDVGGTFTDAVLYDDEGPDLRYAKAPSTPDDPTRGVLDALALLDAPLPSVERLVHGVTIGTNAILEGKGAEVWMLTTEGFRDVLEIARTNRPDLYDIQALKTPPLVPRTRVLEVRERLMYDGSVRLPLDEEAVRLAVARLPTGSQTTEATGDKAVSVAVCFLHSYANPAHEEAVARIVRESGNGRFVCTSAEVLPQFREYERFNTTALNAYIGPLMARYLNTLREGLKERGYGRELFIMTSNGGVSTAERAARMPISTVLSGPAGGVAAAVSRGDLLGMPNLITCDMGGTSTDVCLIEGLQVPVTSEQYIGAYANRTPQIEINAVGAGGGSIAWLDAGDILSVGPQSAGADPGPACYGKGGLEPTVTDANLVLGRLSTGRSLGGRIALDESLALQAITRLREQMGSLDAHTLADGIVRIAVARMVSAIKQISITKGYDPRDFVLTAYGGAGPMHAAFIAEELEIGQIIVPPGPGNFAAFGSLISDIREDVTLTRTLLTREAPFADIAAQFEALEARGRASLAAQGVPGEDLSFLRSVGMRYLGQSWELEVSLPPAIASTAALEAAIGEVHDRRFGHRSGGPSEIVNFKLASIGLVAKPQPPPMEEGGSLEDARAGTRPVYFQGAAWETPVFHRNRLPPQAGFSGPAVLEESGATVIVPPGWKARVLEWGDLLMERESP